MTARLVEFNAMLLVFAQGRGEAVRGTKLHDAARKHVQGKVLDSAELSALRDAAADVSVRIRYRGHVRAHLPVRKSTSQSGAGVASMAWRARFVHCAARIVRRHIDICRPAWALA